MKYFEASTTSPTIFDLFFQGVLFTDFVLRSSVRDVLKRLESKLPRQAYLIVLMYSKLAVY